MSAVAITTLFCSCSEGDKKDIQRAIEWQKNPQAAADKVGKEVAAIIKELVTPTTSSEERAQYFHPDIKDKVDFFPIVPLSLACGLNPKTPTFSNLLE